MQENFSKISPIIEHVAPKYTNVTPRTTHQPKKRINFLNKVSLKKLMASCQNCFKHVNFLLCIHTKPFKYKIFQPIRATAINTIIKIQVARGKKGVVFATSCGFRNLFCTTPTSQWKEKNKAINI